MEGFFIAVEGLDGAGKSTQVKALARWLEGQGRETVLTAEPSAGPMGRLVREGLSGRLRLSPAAMALLFAADRLDHLARTVEPALDQGQVVVSDRYLLSSLAYQSVHNNPDWVATVNSRARPADLTILLDLPVEVCLERLKGRSRFRDIYESAELLGSVRLNYLDLAAKGNKAGQQVATIDARQPRERVRRLVIQAAAGALDLKQ